MVEQNTVFLTGLTEQPPSRTRWVVSFILILRWILLIICIDLMCSGSFQVVCKIYLVEWNFWSPPTSPLNAFYMSVNNFHFEEGSPTHHRPYWDLIRWWLYLFLPKEINDFTSFFLFFFWAKLIPYQNIWNILIYHLIFHK